MDVEIQLPIPASNWWCTSSLLPIAPPVVVVVAVVVVVVVGVFGREVLGHVVAVQLGTQHATRTLHRDLRLDLRR